MNQEEFTAAVNRFCILGQESSNSEPTHKANFGTQTIYFGRTGTTESHLTVGIVPQSQMGAFGQFALASQTIKETRPRAIISLGVCWGNPKLLTERAAAFFGDVVVSEAVVQFSLNTRLDSVLGNDGLGLSGSLLKPSELLIARFRDMSLPGQWKFLRYATKAGYQLRRS